MFLRDDYMVNSQQQTCEEKASDIMPSVLSTAVNALCNKYFFISLAAVAVAGAAVLFGSDNPDMLFDTVTAAIFGMAMWLVQHFWLRGYGVSRKMMLDNKKSVDPRLLGSLGDLNSLGSSMGALAGISIVLSRLFIIDIDLFDRGEILIPLLEAVACALSVGVAVSVTTSRPSLRCSLYIITGKAFGARGDEILKKTVRASNNEELMYRLRKMSCVRLIAAIAVSIIIVISALSGAGSAFSCAQTAFLSMLAVGLSGCCEKAPDSKLCDEKISLFSKKSKRMCVMNTIAIVLLSVVFIFSFPFRSVYTDYTPRYDYEYGEEISEEIEYFSVPAAADESYGMLFNGLFLSVTLMIAAVSGAYSLKGSFSSISQLSSELIGACFGITAAVLSGFAMPYAALDAVRILVAFVPACLLIFVNMFSLYSKKKAANE